MSIVKANYLSTHSPAQRQELLTNYHAIKAY